MLHTVLEALIGAMSVSAFAIAGWAFMEVAKIESLEDNVRYIRGRVDDLYDHLIDRERPHQG